MPRFYPIVSSLFRPQSCQQAIGRTFIRPLLTAPRHFFSTSSQSRVHHYTRTNKSTSTNDHHYDQRYQYYEQVTESTVLSSFPRPNLNPTLHYTLFTTSYDTSSNTNASKKKCKHCHGPHLSENCPC